MPAYLLTWNPNRCEWDDLPNVVQTFQNGNAVKERWSCGNTKRIEAGDLVFLIRLGREPKGICAYGTVVKGSYEDDHWEKDGKTALYVEFQIDWIVEPDAKQFVPRARLDAPQFADVHWSSQSSGIAIPDKVAAALKHECTRYLSSYDTPLPEEVPSIQKYKEGAQRIVVINSCERNPQARRACIEHYGAVCAVCRRDLADKYGKVGKGVIHVHHLRPLASRSKRYVLDPIRDLRPVCPNCHAIIHTRKRPYSVEDVQNMIDRAR